MTSALAEILAEIRDLVDNIDAAAVTALRAQERARRASAAYGQAATGTDHPQMKSALANARMAGEKAGKTARLLAEAANAYTEYANTISPGAFPVRQTSATALPSGEELVVQAGDRGGKKKFGKFSRKLSESASDLGDAGNNLIEFAEQAPPGSAITVQPVEQYIPEKQTTPDEVASTLIIVGAIAAAAAAKIQEFIDKKEQTHHDRSA
jgi:hypothetical protein